MYEKIELGRDPMNHDRTGCPSAGKRPVWRRATTERALSAMGRKGRGRGGRGGVSLYRSAAKAETAGARPCKPCKPCKKCAQAAARCPPPQKRADGFLQTEGEKQNGISRKSNRIG